MWTGAEPSEGEFNETYIEILQQIVEKLSERGIYTMLDMHQDVLSSYYYSYDGVPPWLIEMFPDPTNPYPYPLEEIVYWEEGYLTQACSEGFQHLYDNYADSLELHWYRFWGYIAEHFRHIPSVLGYNFMNEPWIGDYLNNSELKLPGVAGSENLMPAYDILNEAIREKDSEGIVFYEPVIYGQLFHGEVQGSGFDRVPGGDEYQNVSAYSYHTYCWSLEFLDPGATEEEQQQALDDCEQKLLPNMFNSQEQNVNLTGGASILTEFGICKTSGDAINIECETIMDFCDDYLQSWIEWDYNDGKWYTNGNRVEEKIIVYIRPYARAVAGRPTLMKFNTDTLEFVLEYDVDNWFSAPTEIFLAPARYSDGVTITASEGVSWDIEDDVLMVYNPEEIPAKVVVNITPRWSPSYLQQMQIIIVTSLFTNHANQLKKIPAILV